MITESALKKWHGKKVSVFGYKYNPRWYNSHKYRQVVFHYVGTIEEANLILENPMWCKEWSEDDVNKSLLGNTGILVDDPKLK